MTDTTTQTDPTMAIIEALGLDPHAIRANGVTIQLDRVGVPPTVTVHYHAHKLPPLAPTLRRYKLVPIDYPEPD